MKKYIKIISIVLNVLVVLLALGVLGYYLGWKKVETKLRQEGFNVAINQIVQTVKQTGEVNFGNNLILIPKISE